MYRNRDGQFSNKLHGNIIISDYDGGFSEVGIIAIVSDVLDKTRHLSHWIWYQRPSPTAGITPDAINELLDRYKTLDKHGCVGLGVLNQNVLIKSFVLPDDNSIRIPISISKDDKKLFLFFKDTLGKLDKSTQQELQKKREEDFRSNGQDIFEKFEASCQILVLSNDDIVSLIGQGYQQIESLSTQQLQTMQAFTVFERLVSFRFEGEQQSCCDWLNTVADSSNQTIREKVLSKDGLYEVLHLVRDTDKESV